MVLIQKVLNGAILPDVLPATLEKYFELESGDLNIQ